MLCHYRSHLAVVTSFPDANFEDMQSEGLSSQKKSHHKFPDNIRMRKSQSKLITFHFWGYVRKISGISDAGNRLTLTYEAII